MACCIKVKGAALYEQSGNRSAVCRELGLDDAAFARASRVCFQVKGLSEQIDGLVIEKFRGIALKIDYPHHFNAHH